MRKSLTLLVSFAGAAAFAAPFSTVAQAGDAAPDSAAVYADGDCGFGQAYLQAQIDAAKAAEQAETKAKIEALIDSALQSKETAAVPAGAPAPNSGG